jgi:hypothetical protein
MSSTPEEEDLLIEAVASAWRPHGPGELQYHPHWHDLAEQDRIRAFDRATQLRKMEAALDADGLSTTARAVLARIRGQ